MCLCASVGPEPDPVTWCLWRDWFRIRSASLSTDQSVSFMPVRVTHTPPVRQHVESRHIITEIAAHILPSQLTWPVHVKLTGTWRYTRGLLSRQSKKRCHFDYFMNPFPFCSIFTGLLSQTIPQIGRRPPPPPIDDMGHDPGAVIVVWCLACSTVDRQVGRSNLPCVGALWLLPRWCMTG